MKFRAAESGFWPQQKPFSGSCSEGGPTRNLYTKSERMTVSCRVTGAFLKGLIGKSTNNGTNEKEKKDMQRSRSAGPLPDRWGTVFCTDFPPSHPHW